MRQALKSGIDELKKSVRELCRTHRIDEARSACSEYLQELSNEFERAEVLHSLAYVEKSAGNVRAAIVHLTEARATNPKSRAVLHSLADALIRIGNFKGAADTCITLIDLDRQFPYQSFTSSAYLQLAYAHLQLGDFEIASTALERCQYDGPAWIDERLVSRETLQIIVKDRLGHK